MRPKKVAKIFSFLSCRVLMCLGGACILTFSLGPDNCPYLAQRMTPQNGIFMHFWSSLNCVQIPIFTVLFWTSSNFCPKWAKKTITFHILQNTGYSKRKFSCNPQLHQKLVFYIFWKIKNIDVDQKHNLRKGEKPKTGKTIEKQTKRKQ